MKPKSFLFTGDDDDRRIHVELVQTVFRFWSQWLCVILVITAWVLITFLLPVPDCPTGYLGPGGRHEHGKYFNCTGGEISYERDSLWICCSLGAAGYVDRKVLGAPRLYDGPTCKEIYKTEINYDPEGKKIIRLRESTVCK